MKKVLFPTDLSDDQITSLQFAHQFAQANEASLHILFVTWPTRSSRRPYIDEAYSLEKDKRSLRTWAGLHLDSMDNVFVHAQFGHVAETIVDYVDRFNIHTVIMAQRKSFDVFDFTFGNKIQHVVKKVSAPVIVLPYGTLYKEKWNILTIGIEKNFSDATNNEFSIPSSQIVNISWLPFKPLKKTHWVNFLFGNWKKKFSKILESMQYASRADMMVLQQPAHNRNHTYRFNYAAILTTKIPLCILPSKTLLSKDNILEEIGRLLTLKHLAE